MSRTPSSTALMLAPRVQRLHRRPLVAATRAAAARGFGCLALFHLEGVAAAARGGDVRIVDREPGLQALDPVDLGAREIRRAERIDDDIDAVHVQLVVTLLRTPVEAERVLEARAPAALDGDAQNGRLARGLLGHKRPDLLRRARGERDERRLFDSSHGPIVAACSHAARAPFGGFDEPTL